MEIFKKGSVDQMKMPRSKRKISLLYLSVDLFFIFICFWVSYLHYYFKQGLGEGLKYLLYFQFGSLPLFSQYFGLFFFFCITTFFFLKNYGLYTTKRGRPLTDEIICTFKGVSLSGLLGIAFVFVTKSHVISRLVLFESVFMTAVSLSAWRVCKRREVEHLVASGYANQNALIIGAGRMGKLLARELSKQGRLGLRVAGFLDDSKEVGESTPEGKVLGRISELESVVHKNFIDQVFITVSSYGESTNRTFSRAKEWGVGVKIVPEFFENASPNFALSYIGSLPILEYHCNTVESEVEWMVKRLMDIVFSFVGLVLLSPFLIAIGLLIKLESPGPVFYVSPRIGRKGKIFKFYKFRSMHADAEERLAELSDKNEKDGPIFKMKEDPRMTRIGRFIRKYSIDELPQLWNVLRGDMSLVGPRPPIPSEVSRYKDWQLRRINVVPGMTSPYVVQGRSDLSFEEWIKSDLDYIENWSLWLDIKILFQVIPAVLKGTGAY